MRWRFDHVVIVVCDLETTIGSYEAAGFSVARGGQHPDTSAVNGLIGLDDESYLELFSFSDPEKAPRHHANRLPFDNGGGFGSFWCRTSNIAEDIGQMRAADVRIEDGRAGSRVRPDGFEVKFRLAVPSRDEYPYSPALIEDITALSERLPAASEHRNGASVIAAISCRVPDLQGAAAFYSRMLGQPPAVATSEAGVSSLSLQIGATQLRFVEERNAQDFGVQAIEIRSRSGRRAVIVPNTESPVFN